jgi:glutathione synthase/RimK-type ligase-like ATP-grasp enzyme
MPQLKRRLAPRKTTTMVARKPRPLILIRRTSVSDGARALKNKLNAIGVRTVLTDKTMFKGKYLIMQWGYTAAPKCGFGSRIMNLPTATSVARDKLATFNALKNREFGNLPDFWTEAPTDEQRGKSIILERTTSGQSGSGIVVKRPGEYLGRAPLYVRYVPKEIELRVHVLNGKAIAVQQKRKVDGREQTDNQKLIRNHDNGWVFAVNDVNVAAATAAKPVAIEACRLLGLDFGAVDIVIPKATKKNPTPAPVFLEVNTRPGLESDTVLTAYATELKAMAA